jgi:hypothetical protein
MNPRHSSSGAQNAEQRGESILEIVGGARRLFAFPLITSEYNLVESLNLLLKTLGVSVK